MDKSTLLNLTSMISIVTAIYNQLEINAVFAESLRRYTRHPFELIVVDNGSNDGSREFFKSAGATVIENHGNYSYPRCQNQGIRAARFDTLAFLNNDLIVSPDWDDRLLQVMDRNGLDVVTACGVERLQNDRATRFYRKKWSLVRNIFRLFSGNRGSLRLMHRVMYGNWDRFTEKRWARFGCSIREGFVGSSVVMKRGALDKIGLWDERIQQADFDLFFRSKKRSQEQGDMRPVQVAMGVFNHHYIRMTLRGGYPEFKDRGNLISLEKKWGREQIAAFLKALD